MSRKDDEHNVLMNLGHNVDLLREIAQDNQIDGYTRENPGHEVKVAVDNASDELRERLERFQETAENAEDSLEKIAESQAESAESLIEISDHTSNLPGMAEDTGVIADGVEEISYGVDRLGELGQEMVEEQATTNTKLRIISEHTEELPAIRSDVRTLKRIAGGHLGLAAIGVVGQVVELQRLGEIRDELCELHDDINQGFDEVVDGLEEIAEGLENVESAIQDVESAVEDVEHAVEEAGQKISQQIAISAAASAQKIADHLDIQTNVVSQRLATLAQISDRNRQAVVAAIERFNQDEERRKQKVVDAIRSSHENDAEAKFRDALMHLSIRRYGAAINTLGQVFQYQDTHAPAWMFFGDCAWRLGQSTEARNAYYLASRYALMSKQAGRDSLSMKNKEIFELSLVRLSRLESLLGNDAQARKVLVEGKKAWGKPRTLTRIRYELIRLAIRAKPRVGIKKVSTLVSLAKQIPDIREEISTSPIFESARYVRHSLKYGNGPFVQLAEALDFFDTKPLLEIHDAIVDPRENYRLYVYSQLHGKLREDLENMTGDCRTHKSAGISFEKWQSLEHVQKQLLELKQLYVQVRRDWVRQGICHEQAGDDALWTMLTKLHLMVWEKGVFAKYLGWKRPVRNKLFSGEQQQPHSPSVQALLKKVCKTLNQLCFFKRNHQVSRMQIQLSDLSIIDGKFEFINGIGAVFVPCPYYFYETPVVDLPQAIPISPWWQPNLNAYQSVVVFTPLSSDEAEDGIQGRAMCIPLDCKNPHSSNGSFDADRIVKVVFEPTMLEYARDGKVAPRNVQAGWHQAQRVFHLSGVSLYDDTGGEREPISVRVGFFNFNELQVIKVLRGFKTLPRKKAE